MRLFLMLVPYLALGSLAAVAPQPSGGAVAANGTGSTGYWQAVGD